MTRPIPMSDPVADDRMLDAIARRQHPGDDPVAGLLSALAGYADQPLAPGSRRRRSQRHRLFTGLAALTIGASGAGVAAAVGIPDGPPDLPPRVAPSRVEQPAPSLPRSTFGLERPSRPGAEPVIVLTPEGTLLTSYYLPAAWGPVVLSQISADRSSASEISRSRWSDLEIPPRSLPEVAPTPAPEGDAPVRRRPRPTVGKPGDDAQPKVAGHPSAPLRGKSKPAPVQGKPAEPGKSHEAPAQGKPAEPGKSHEAPAQGKPAEPGKSHEAPAQGKPAEPGKSHEAPAQGKPAEPGKSHEAPAQAEHPTEDDSSAETPVVPPAPVPATAEPDPSASTDPGTVIPTVPSRAGESQASPAQTAPTEVAPTASQDAPSAAGQG